MNSIEKLSIDQKEPPVKSVSWKCGYGIYPDRIEIEILFKNVEARSGKIVRLGQSIPALHVTNLGLIPELVPRI